MLYGIDGRNGEMWMSPNSVELTTVANEIGKISILLCLLLPTQCTTNRNCIRND